VLGKEVGEGMVRRRDERRGNRERGEDESEQKYNIKMI
jgi:hypothetical protein